MKVPGARTIRFANSRTKSGACLICFKMAYGIDVSGVTDHIFEFEFPRMANKHLIRFNEIYINVYCQFCI